MKLEINLPEKLYQSLQVLAAQSGKGLKPHILDVLKEHVASRTKQAFGKEMLQDVAMSTIQAGIAALSNKIGGGR